MKSFVTKGMFPCTVSWNRMDTGPLFRLLIFTYSTHQRHPNDLKTWLYRFESSGHISISHAIYVMGTNPYKKLQNSTSLSLPKIDRKHANNTPTIAKKELIKLRTAKEAATADYQQVTKQLAD